MSLRFNPFTGNFDVVADNANFSIKKVLINEVTTIPEFQEMIVTKNISIDGELIIDGELSIL